LFLILPSQQPLSLATLAHIIVQMLTETLHPPCLQPTATPPLNRR
jgi:hypothetical protein